MKKIKKSLKYIVIIIVIVLVGAGVYFYNKYNLKSNQNINNITENIGNAINNISSNNSKNTTDKIIYAKINENDKQILIADADGKNIKTIFSDKDDDLKINKFGGLAYLSKEILVLAGSGPIGKLEVIKSDGSGDKSTINESFGTPEDLSISPDGKTICYVSFSNAERDYGYSIYTMTRTGTNKRKITTSDKNIGNITFNKNGTKIAYTLIDKNNKSQINTTDLNSDKSDQVYTSSNPIYSLSWNSSDKIIFSVATNKLKAGTVYNLDIDGSNIKKLFDSKDNLPVYDFISSDMLNFNYILNSYDDSFDPLRQGDLYSHNLSSNNTQKIDKANIILGWLP